MSLYKDKALNNYKTAAHLVDMDETSNMYIPSAHFAYYSAFLIVKHALANYNSISYQDQDRNSRGASSHNNILRIFICKLREASNSDMTFNDIMQEYSRMQYYRQQADYKTDTTGLTYDAMKDNVDMAKSFYNKVATIYNFDQL